MAEDRMIEMNPENLTRALLVAHMASEFRDPLRQRYLVAAVLARAVSDQDIYELVNRCAKMTREELDAKNHAGDQQSTDR